MMIDQRFCTLACPYVNSEDDGSGQFFFEGFIQSSGYSRGAVVEMEGQKIDVIC